MSAPEKIRVAVLTRADSLESWEIAALEAVKKLEFAEIVLEVRDASTSYFGHLPTGQAGAQYDKRPQQAFGSKILRYKWSRLFWNRWFKKYGKVNATREISSREIFAGVPRIDVTPELKGKYSQHFSPADLEKVKAYSPEVIIRFGFNILRGEILNVAKHGVWSYHHADHETIRGGPAGFWEYLLHHNRTGAMLQRLNEKLDAGTILRSGYWPLVKHSFRENLDTLLSCSSSWIANALTEIQATGKVSEEAASPANVKVYSYPGNFRMLQFWCILSGNKIAFHWNNLFRPETWQIGIVDQPLSDVIENGITGTIAWLRAKKNDSYLADPFPLQRNGETILASEYFCGTEQRSRIVNARTEETIYHPDHHVSFPMPVEIDGRHYFLPEQSASGKCELIEADNTGNRITLLDEPLVDPVLFLHNNTWWLFAHKLHDQNNSALFIYHADSITGGFQPHLLNPVKTSISNSRSAGPIIFQNGKLLRPAQDSTRTYGAAIVINEIVTLSAQAYKEVPVKVLEPKPEWSFNKGLHTIAPFGNKTLIDAKSFRFNFANFKAQLSRKARRISGQ